MRFWPENEEKYSGARLRLSRWPESIAGMSMAIHIVEILHLLPTHPIMVRFGICRG
jgi:hypothetical protein